MSIFQPSDVIIAKCFAMRWNSRNSCKINVDQIVEKGIKKRKGYKKKAIGKFNNCGSRQRARF